MFFRRKHRIDRRQRSRKVRPEPVVQQVLPQIASVEDIPKTVTEWCFCLMMILSARNGIALICQMRMTDQDVPYLPLGPLLLSDVLRAGVKQYVPSIRNAGGLYPGSSAPSSQGPYLHCPIPAPGRLRMKMSGHIPVELLARKLLEFINGGLHLISV